jgi:outer membrane immunogenic protein
MKFLLFGMTVSLSILGTAASGSASGSAAPALSRAAVPIAAPYDWSGFYIGGNGGWGAGNSCSTFTNGAWDNQLLLYNPKFNGCHDATGGTAGGQIGYRWQSSSWVLGLEAQGNWADFQGDNRAAAIVPADLINTSRTDSFGLFTGQIGYAWNNLLVTVKGGGAVTHNIYATAFEGATFDEARDTRWGAAVGVSVDYGFAPNWSLGLNYDHLFMGSRPNLFVATRLAFDPVGFLTQRQVINQDINLVTVRINYRFGG